MKLARRTEPTQDDDWPPRRLRGVRVLVVDDDPDERDFLVALLGAAAAEVRSAASTAEALATLAWWWPSVLLSDIGMQRRRRVRADPCRPDDAARPSTAASRRRGDRAHARPRTVAAHSAPGYQAHLAKPIDPDRLISLVASLASPQAAPAS